MRVVGNSRLSDITLQQGRNVVLDHGVPLILTDNAENTDGLLAVTSVGELNRRHI